MSFPGVEFRGVVSSGRLNASVKTNFNFTDGCQWETTQLISGEVDGALSYQYIEGPLPGQRGCARACRADGDVTLGR